jgi:HlyD family secretion protein
MKALAESKPVLEKWPQAGSSNFHGSFRVEDCTRKAGCRPALRPGTALRVCGLLSVVLTGAVALTGCKQATPGNYQGYIEAEYVFVAAPLSGTLEQRPVERGNRVRSGDPLFTLEHASEAAAVDEADRRLAQSEAKLANLRKGQRPTEIASLEARLDQARANMVYWDAERARRAKLIEDHAISQAEFELVRSQDETSKAQVASLTADLKTARLGAREDEVRAGEAEVAAAKASSARTRWSLDQKTRVAPAGGVIHDTLYRVGEWVSAGSAVVSLLPPENLKVRFFVPETDLGRIRLGQAAAVRLDGMTTPLGAKVSYVSTQAEFTPPVIYSRETRAKLVFMVEARLEAAIPESVHPGQPAEVQLQEGQP